jgi:hypothetical protein
LKKHEYANAGWEDLVNEFETAGGKDLDSWSMQWVLRPGMPQIRITRQIRLDGAEGGIHDATGEARLRTLDSTREDASGNR